MGARGLKLLITGGCGFLGSNLARHAAEQGLDVLIFDNFKKLSSIENYHALTKYHSVNFISADIRSSNDVRKAIQSFMPDAIFHLAGQVAMTTSIDNPEYDFQVNALGTLNVLNAVKDFCPDSLIIYSSTNKVYGDLSRFTYIEGPTRYSCHEQPMGFDETCPLEFHSPYGCSKGAADQYLLDFHRIFGLKTIVFRHSSMYGGNQYATFDQGWVGWFCMEALRRKRGCQTPISIAGNGKQVRDLLHADDMVDLYFSALANHQGASGSAFNIGGGIKNSLSLIELFSFLETELEINLEIHMNEPRESDQLVFVADSSKAQEAFDWNPKVDYESGLRRMLDWVSALNDL